MDLHREHEAAKLVAEQVRALAGDDPEFIRDAIEGETNLVEAIGAVGASLLEDQASRSALDIYIKRLELRRDKIDARIEVKRSLIASAMETAERAKIVTPLATLSLRPVPPKVVVFEEADIPAEFWEPQPPKLDRRAVLDALKEQRPVPGARLSNGTITVSIRQ